MAEKKSDINEINDFIQKKMQQLNIEGVSPVEATRWLVQARLHGKMDSRPGSYIRSLCRRGRIRGAEQHNKSWIIKKI